MLIPKEAVKAALQKAKEFTEQYELYVADGKDVKRSIDDSKRLCQDLVDKPIQYSQLRLRAENHPASSFYVRTANGYEICLLEGLNTCWTRYCTVKEIFHVIMDDDPVRTVDVYGHLEEIMTSFPADDAIPGPAAASEFLTELAAMEFLFPYSRRLIELRAAKPDYLAIARTYMIPLMKVEEYLSDSYMKQLAFHNE